MNDHRRFRITELQPLATAGRDACEQHYVTEHIPMIVRARRTDTDVRVLQYRPHRAEALLDGERWGEPTRHWRFVFVTYVGEGTLGASDTRRIARDHRNWVQDLRSYEVIRQVRTDRRSGQLSSAKYLVLGVGQPALGDRLAQSRSALEELAADAFGLRLYLTNDAIAEQEAVDDEAPRQRFTRNTLPVAGLRWYDELYFDSPAAAHEFFVTASAAGALPPGSSVLRVSELVAYDRT